MLNSAIKCWWVPVMRGSCGNQAFRWTQNKGCSSQVTPRNSERLDNQIDGDGPQTNNQDREQGLSWEHYPRLEPGKKETGLTVRSWPNFLWPPLLHGTFHSLQPFSPSPLHFASQDQWLSHCIVFMFIDAQPLNANSIQVGLCSLIPKNGWVWHTNRSSI